MKNKTFILKALDGQPSPDADKLAKINRFALTALTDDQVYARRYLMAHNGIDRDVERFTEALLADFARTLPGKGFFVEGHPSSWSGSGGPGRGRFFDAYVEEMTPEQFKTITGEDIRLPEGVQTATVLWGEAYLLKLDSNKDTIANIDGGIYSFVSIGFKAPYAEVTDERGNRLYGEYKVSGEALEGSLVWLGAQPGASAKEKERGGNDNIPHTEHTGGKGIMKDFLEKLKKVFGRVFTEDGAVDEIKAMIDEKDAKLQELSRLAEEGKAYRKALIEDTIRFGVLIDEIKTDTDEQKKEAEYLATVPIDRLKALRDKYETKAREQFPDTFTFSGKDSEDREKAAAEAKKKQQQTSGKKDFTDPAQNDLFATLGK